jgi:hypothetical protein
MKRLAAAMLLAVINLMSAGNVADASIDVDDDNDADADVSPDSVSEFRKPSRGLDRYDALALTSHACHEPLDAAWVVRHHGKVGGAAAVTVRQAAPHVAVVTLVVDRDCPTWPGVLARALHFCREEENALKVVIEHDGVTDVSITNAVESCGFQPIRARRNDGGKLLECYADLYRRSTPALPAGRCKGPSFEVSISS